MISCVWYSLLYHSQNYDIIAVLWNYTSGGLQMEALNSIYNECHRGPYDHAKAWQDNQDTRNNRISHFVFYRARFRSSPAEICFFLCGSMQVLLVSGSSLSCYQQMKQVPFVLVSCNQFLDWFIPVSGVRAIQKIDSRWLVRFDSRR